MPDRQRTRERTIRPTDTGRSTGVGPSVLVRAHAGIRLTHRTSVTQRNPLRDPSMIRRFFSSSPTISPLSSSSSDWRPLSSCRHFDVAIIGGGILGLTTAREVLERNPHMSVVVLEKEREIAAHQTDHNSGVIHAGKKIRFDFTIWQSTCTFVLHALANSSHLSQP